MHCFVICLCNVVYGSGQIYTGLLLFVVSGTTKCVGMWCVCVCVCVCVLCVCVGMWCVCVCVLCVCVGMCVCVRAVCVCVCCVTVQCFRLGS